LQENQEEDKNKKIKASLLLKKKFDKESNFQEYIKTIENLIKYE